MLKYQFSMVETIAMAVILLILGRWIKSKISVLEKYFIPAPVIGGLIFSICTLIARSAGWFEVSFAPGAGDLKTLLMIAFFTTIGFVASLKLLKQGGKGVFIFLVIATLLIIIQDFVGVGLAKVLGLHPLLGLAAGSIPLTGGHGTSAAFAPLLEEIIGKSGAMTVAIASATYGLVMGCIIGGPVAKKLMQRYKLTPHKEEEYLETDANTGKIEKEEITEHTLFSATCYILISMGIGMILFYIFKRMGITLPSYIGAMLVAAIVRNYADAKNIQLPIHTIDTLGSLALQLFLAMALMSLNLWELSELAGPLLIILVVQTIVMILFAYFITFRLMGRDYDAAVMASGHCGFGLGATPNAMANMESFTAANGPSPKAFFIVPIVGALFIDFTNAAVITTFISFFG